MKTITDHDMMMMMARFVPEIRGDIWHGGLTTCIRAHVGKDVEMNGVPKQCRLA